MIARKFEISEIDHSEEIFQQRALEIIVGEVDKFQGTQFSQRHRQRATKVIGFQPKLLQSVAPFIDVLRNDSGQRVFAKI